MGAVGISGIVPKEQRGITAQTRCHKAGTGGPSVKKVKREAQLSENNPERAKAGPRSRCRCLRRAEPGSAQPPHTVLYPAQASAEILCEDLTGGVAEGAAAVQIHNGRCSTHLPGPSVYHTDLSSWSSLISPW